MVTAISSSCAGYKEHEEPYYLSQQIGSFEVLSEGNNGFARQMVTEMPIPWCMKADGIQKAYSVFGDAFWSVGFGLVLVLSKAMRYSEVIFTRRTNWFRRLLSWIC